MTTTATPTLTPHQRQRDLARQPKRIATDRHQREAFRLLRLPFWPRDLAIVLADKANAHRKQLVLMYAEHIAHAEAHALQQHDPKRSACGDDA